LRPLKNHLSVLRFYRCLGDSSESLCLTSHPLILYQTTRT
jgi:hypothetical protein